jgi:hypothetical protein
MGLPGILPGKFSIKTVEHHLSLLPDLSDSLGDRHSRAAWPMEL